MKDKKNGENKNETQQRRVCYICGRDISLEEQNNSQYFHHRGHTICRDCVDLQTYKIKLKKPRDWIQFYGKGDELELSRSSRDRKIIGNSGEMIIANWLSRSGFEVFYIDHVGIDLVAYEKKLGCRMGITIKSRRTGVKNFRGQISIFNNNKGDRLKLESACEALGAEPWIAVYVENLLSADIYMVSLGQFNQIIQFLGRDYRKGREKDGIFEGFFKMFGNPFEQIGISGRSIDTWNMAYDLEKYPFVKHIHYDFKTTNWAWHAIDFKEKVLKDTALQEEMEGILINIIKKLDERNSYNGASEEHTYTEAIVEGLPIDYIQKKIVELKNRGDLFESKDKLLKVSRD